MSSEREAISVDKAHRILAGVGVVQKVSVQMHLTDEEFADFMMGTLPSREVARIELHLGMCSECSNEVEFLRGESAAWRTLEGEERLRRNQESLLGMARSSARHPSTVVWPSFTLPKAAATGKDVRGETEIYGYVLRYRIVESGGSLKVILASDSVALEGHKVLLSAPGFRRELTLNRVREDQVGAKTTIERSERECLSAGALVLLPLENE